MSDLYIVVNRGSFVVDDINIVVFDIDFVMNGSCSVVNCSELKKGNTSQKIIYECSSHMHINFGVKFFIEDH